MVRENQSKSKIEAGGARQRLKCKIPKGKDPYSVTWFGCAGRVFSAEEAK